VKNVLYLAEIAEYCSRELRGVRIPSEIYAELLSAFWQDQLAVVHVQNLHPIQRLNVLKAMNATRYLIPDHPGLTLVDCAEMIPPKVEQHPDGRWTIDRGVCIVLSPEDADWTEGIRAAAYYQLAKTPLDDFHELQKPPIVGLGATKEALAACCDLVGWDRPRFWFRNERRRPSAVRRQREFEAWFKQIVSGPKQKTKLMYLAEAIKLFSGLPRTSLIGSGPETPLKAGSAPDRLFVNEEHEYADKPLI